MTKEERMKKLDNFWYYYKWHVIIGIFVAVVLFFTIHDAVTNVDPDITIDCIMDSGISYMHTEALESDLEANAGINDNNGDENIKCTIAMAQTGRDPSTASADGSMMQVVQLRMAVGESTIIITEPYILDLYQEHEIFGDMTAIADEMNIPEEKRYMSPDNSKVIAINIDDSEFLKKQGISSTDCFVSLRVLNLDQQNNEQKVKEFENSKEIIKYIIK